MEKLEINSQFWKSKKVFMTGHTGFKGSWLSIWLNNMGANVTGFALAPPTEPSIFKLAQLENKMHSIEGNIQNFEFLKKELIKAQPEIIFHLAAQPLVRLSYKEPIETYATNVMGTVHLLEAVKSVPSVKAIVIVTSDKCYENKEWHWSYRENEPMGGYDPYSNSKGCAELVVAAFRSSYFNPLHFDQHKVGIASARAGNVIGGGDWAKDRLVPDILNSFTNHKNIVIRNPNSIRPWQHVLEPLSGYLSLAENLYQNGASFSDAWNFGPLENDVQNVEWIVKRMKEKANQNISIQVERDPNQLHEAHYLKLDSSKARAELKWRSRWTIDQTIDSIIEWHSDFINKKNIYETCTNQIEKYLRS